MLLVSLAALAGCTSTLSPALSAEQLSGRGEGALTAAQDATVAQPVGRPYYPHSGFAYAPYLSPYFAGAPIYDGPFDVNPLYWRSFDPVMRSVQLPTADRLSRALAEGVLQPGGRVTGFLYFEGVGPEVAGVRLVADFPNADTGERLVRLGIPFRVG